MNFAHSSKNWETLPNSFLFEKGLISIVCKELVQQFLRSLIKIWIKALNKLFSKRACEDQQVHEQVFSITYHQGNANQNYNVMSPYIYQRLAFIKKTTRKQVLARMWKKENPVHCWWKWKLSWPLWKIKWNFLQKKKYRTTT